MDICKGGINQTIFGSVHFSQTLASLEVNTKGTFAVLMEVGAA